MPKRHENEPQIVKTIQNLITEIQALESERPRFVIPYVTEIYKEITVDAAHLLPQHDAKCKFLHGHTYRVGITVEGRPIREGAKEGMVMDFGDLKEHMKHVVDDNFDHQYINDTLKFVTNRDFNRKGSKTIYLRTTAEQMAWWIFLVLDESLHYDRQGFHENSREYNQIHKARVVRVDVWETPTSRATAKREHFDGHGEFSAFLRDQAFPPEAGTYHIGADFAKKEKDWSTPVNAYPEPEKPEDWEDIGEVKAEPVDVPNEDEEIEAPIKLKKTPKKMRKVQERADEERVEVEVDEDDE